jgi:hypothetical protein
MKPFETWTVLSHRPIEKMADNLWRVEGDFEVPLGDATRVMTLAKLADGRVVIHSGIALEEELMKEIEAWGKPTAIVAPNGFHRLDAKVFKKRYPDAKVYCPRGAVKKVSEVVHVDGTLDDAPSDDTVRFTHLAGMKEAEGVLEVRSPNGGGTTLVLNDVVFNVPKRRGLGELVLGPTGKPAIPRVARWFLLKDKKAFRSQLEKLADTPDLKRVIVSHGRPLTEAPASTLRELASTV